MIETAAQQHGDEVQVAAMAAVQRLDDRLVLVEVRGAAMSGDPVIGAHEPAVEHLVGVHHCRERRDAAPVKERRVDLALAHGRHHVRHAGQARVDRAQDERLHVVRVAPARRAGHEHGSAERGAADRRHRLGHRQALAHGQLQDHVHRASERCVGRAGTAKVDDGLLQSLAVGGAGHVARAQDGHAVQAVGASGAHQLGPSQKPREVGAARHLDPRLHRVEHVDDAYGLAGPRHLDPDASKAGVLPEVSGERLPVEPEDTITQDGRGAEPDIRDAEAGDLEVHADDDSARGERRPPKGVVHYNICLQCLKWPPGSDVTLRPSVAGFGRAGCAPARWARNT